MSVRTASLSSLALAAAASLFLLSLLVVEVYDLDVWWHLAIGREILASRSIPTVDAWTVLGAGRLYHDSHWLFQIVLALSFRLAGWIGVQLLVVALWGTTLAASWKLARRHCGPTAAWALTAIVALACAERFLPRPELATYAAFSAFLLWFDSNRQQSGTFLARIVLVQALWTNAHGLFVLGPFVALCHLLAVLASSERRRSQVRPATRALAGTALATLLTPRGILAWEYAWLIAREAGQSSAELVGSLGEMTSPFDPQTLVSPAIWAYFVLLAIGVAAAVRRVLYRQLDAALLITVAAAGLSLTGRRNVTLFALAAVPLVAELAAALAASRPALTRPSLRWLLAVALGAASLYPISGAHYLRMEIPARFGLGVTPSFFPHGAARFFATGADSQAVLASNTLGGFVSFHGAPRWRPLTDGRWEIYDPPALMEVLSSTRRPGRWQAVANRHGVTVALLAHNSPEGVAITPEIADDPEWRLVYLDAAAALWTRRASEAGQPDLDRSTALERIQRFEDGILLARFGSLSGDLDLEIAALYKALAFETRRIAVLELLGAAEIRAERFADAEATFTELVGERPDHPIALNELAFLAYRGGELDRAIAFLDRLVQVEPENEEYRSNRERVQEALRSERD